MVDPAGLDELRAFRAEVYACFGRRRDALFEVLDAATTSGLVPSLVHLSLEGLYQRRWGSLYAALAHGEMEVSALRTALARRPLAEGAPIYAVDTSSWPRNDAETSPERGYYYHPSRHSAGKPIVAGWSYSWLAQVGLQRTSWSAPLDVRRVHPRQNGHGVAAEQVRAALSSLPADRPVPTFLFDAGYDPVQLVTELGGARAAVLVRIRRDRCFYPDPMPGSPNPRGGRPRRHGPKFACDDPSTWPPPSWEHAEDDRQYGCVRVRAWAGLHAKTQEHPTRGTRQPRPIINGVLLLVEVSRLPRPTRPTQALWLWWHAPEGVVPELAVLWRAYVRRFDLEHTFRFVKQVLNWTTPRVRLPEQADRWTWLVVLAYTQIRLARSVVEDLRLPWQAPQPPGRLTPGRVRRAFPLLLVRLGTPATAPKPCGRSPGRPRGAKSGPAPRLPALRKAA
jgi:hypothetical protein